MQNKVFIGYDPRQALSYNVLQHSILTKTTEPVSINPLVIEQLPIEAMGLTPFTWSRFLVPWLCGYEGWALFMDADMMLRGDIKDLFALREDDKAVMIVDSKYVFERASLILFNCGHPDNRMLTPEFVNQKPAGLHKVGWTEAVGSLPKEWNHLVLYDEPNPEAMNVHFTAGLPIYPETQGCEFTDEFMNEAKFMASAAPWETLMGASVHAPIVKRFMEKRDGNPVDHGDRQAGHS